MNRFLLYYHYENLSLIDSSLALLKRLNIDVATDDFKFHGGHWGWLVNEQMFFVAQAFNIAKATSLSRDLLVLEEDAYINLVFAKKQINENPMLLNVVQSELSAQNLEYSQDTNIIFLPDLLAQNINALKDLIKSDFSDFSASILHSSRMDREIVGDSLSLVLDALGLKVAFESNFAFFQNELFAPALAYKYSAQLLEGALDSGSDFVLCQSMGAFEMVDKKRKKLSSALNRDLGNISALFLPQVALLALGVRDEVELATRYHKIAPEFL